MSTPFIEENDQTQARREHLWRIAQLVGNVYPNKFRRTNVTASPEGEDTITSIVEAFRRYVPQVEAGARPSAEQLEQANAELSKIEVRLAGRLAVPPRVMGKAAFVHLSDGRERLQIYVRRDDVRGIHNGDGAEVEEGWELFNLLDHGDFIGVEGFLFVTKTGELSVHVRTLQFLAKALLPMPDKMHGISDPEIRQRQRYADLIASSLKVEREPGELTTREVFERRSRLITEMRRYLDEHGYIEVETPMLSPIASGAAARPFKTHHNALDIDLYARIAPELYLKRLLVGGFERVYELNRNFRNEGISTRHNPEFTMLEFYTAYQDVNWMMDFCEEILRETIQTVNGSLQVSFGDETLDFSKFERLTMKQAIVKYMPPHLKKIENGSFSDESWLNDPKRIHQMFYAMELGKREAGTFIATPFASDAEAKTQRLITVDLAWREYREQILAAGDNASDEPTTAQIIVNFFEEMAEGYLKQPTFIHDFPKPVSPLSKASPEDPTIAERFELYVAGMECANGFSELNDPVEQFERFEEQARQRERGDEEAMQTDVDYVRALSYGMPPAAGIGIGIDRLVMLLTNRRSIRDVILFPHMRPQRQAASEESGEGE
ncbi:MAG TPA: lysine--tRNA ligase [Pyrinomonadaceae bacterium]|nr:lysine--tRNA ligase [Pyrinomonadaceae bacterium]